MLDPRQPRLPAQPPSVIAAAAAERAARVVSTRRGPPGPPGAGPPRARARRARRDTSAEARLAGLLRLLARTAGARRAAVLADGIERRCAVSIVPGEDPAAAEALATWLDARSARSRADRAASGLAPISLIVGVDSDDPSDPAPAARDADRRRGPPGRRAGRRGGDECQTSASGRSARTPDRCRRATGRGTRSCRSRRAGQRRPRVRVRRRRRAPTSLAERLPPQLARHAAVALSLVTGQLATERELAVAPGRGGRADAVRLDGRPRAAHAADRSPRLSRADPRRQGRRSGGRARLPRAQPGHRRVDGGPRRRPARAVAAGVRAPSSSRIEPFSVAESVGPRRRRAAADRARVRHPPANVASAPAAVGDRRPAPRRADPDEPRGERPEVHARPAARVDSTAVSTAPSRSSPSVDDGTGIAGDDRPQDLRAVPPAAQATSGSPGRGSGCRSRATSPGGWAATSRSRPCPGSGSAFVLALPGPGGRRLRCVVTAALGRALAAEEIGLEERAVLRAMAMAGRGQPAPAADGAAVDQATLDPARRGRPTDRPPPKPISTPARLTAVIHNLAGASADLVDNPVDWPRRRPVLSGIRTEVTRVTRPARGTGKPGREPDTSRKTDTRPAVRRTSTPGAEPGRPATGTTDRRSAWTVRANRSRRASRTFHPFPRAFGDALDAGLLELGLDLDPGARGRSSTTTLRLLHRLERLDQPDRRSATRRRSPRATSSTASPRSRVLRRARVGGSGSTRSSTSAAAAAIPGSRSPRSCPVERALLVDSVGKKAAFLAAAVAATGLASRVAVAAERGRGARPRPAPSRALAGGHGARRRRRSTSSSSSSFPLLVPGGVARRLEGRRHRRRDPRRRAARWRGLGGGRIESLPVAVDGPRRAPPRRRHEARPDGGRLPARPGGPTPPAVVRHRTRAQPPLLG